MALWANIAVVAAACCPAMAAADNLNVVSGRWLGAQCRTLREFSVGAVRSMDGWSSSLWKKFPAPGGKDVYVKMMVSDHKTLQRAGRLEKGKVMPGTIATGVGWAFENQKKQEGPFLELRLGDSPARVVLRFRSTKGIEDLNRMEQLVRAELCALVAPNPAPTPTAAAVPPPRKSTPVAETAASRAHQPDVKILGASVNPSQVSRGDQVDLVINYSVLDLPPGAEFQVVERRRLKQADRELGTFEEKLARAAGTFTSTQKIQVPLSMASGVYMFEAAVTLAGKSGTATALFEVR